MRYLLVTLSTLILSACGSGSSSSDNSSVGVFIDSAVGGVQYTTGSRSGVTDEQGRFNYQPGENVTFTIGGIRLPTVLASARITPGDIAGGDINSTLSITLHSYC